MPNQQTRWGVTVLRMAVASVFIIHGVTRTALGTVGNFGGFLSSSGFPSGVALAWILTLVEVIGGVALVAGVTVRPLALWFGMELAMGIVMVHGEEGWFVVGAGRNGAEYSVLILACLLVVALTDSASYKVRSGEMKRSSVVLRILVLGGLSSLYPQVIFGAGPAHAAGQSVVRYQVVHGWPQLPPGEMLGQATGVGVDSHGNVLVFHRAGREWTEPFPAEPIARPTVWVFDKTGRFLRSWGAGTFVMPHGLTVDHGDNVWLSDVGLHQVFKFSPDGRLLLTLGEARAAGADASHFNLPTDVAVLKDGSFLVSDGYANTRVVKFAADGTFLMAWGTAGAGSGQFNLPHGIASDASGRVLVADRSNARVQVFDGDGHFLAEWQGPDLGRPYAIAVASDGRTFIADGGDQPSEPPDRSGVAVVDREGRLLTRFGRFGNYDGQLRLAHDIAVGSDGAVYVVDAWGQRVQKFVPQQ